MMLGFTTKPRSLKRWIGEGLLRALTIAVAAGCGKPLPVRPGVGTAGDASTASPPLEMLVSSDPETVDPRYVTDAVGLRASRLIHAGLSRVDPETLRPRPYLATSFRWADRLTLEVRLREDVRFHSGAPFTAEDVVATLRALASPDVASRHLSSVEAIQSAVAEGPYAVRIVLRRPHATLLSDLEVPILRHDQAASAPDASPAALDGLGPFEVSRAERGQMLLVPARFGVSRASVSVALRTVHDENARALRLYGGHADVAVNGISPTLLPALASTGLAVTTERGANLSYLVLRVDRDALADVRLRRAISLAIDRQTLTDSLFAGRAQPASTVLPEGHWAAPKDLSPFPFDPALARDALVGLRRAKGLLPRLTLLTSTDRFRLTVARTLAQELNDVGLDIEVIPLELGTLLARLNAGDFDLASLQIPELTEPNVLRVFLHGASVPPAGSNRGRVRDAELDAFLDEGESSSDESARVSAYAGVERRLRDQLFIVPLWHEDQVAVVSQRGHGFQPSPEGRWLSLAGLTSGGGGW